MRITNEMLRYNTCMKQKSMILALTKLKIPHTAIIIPLNALQVTERYLPGVLCESKRPNERTNEQTSRPRTFDEEKERKGETG